MFDKESRESQLGDLGELLVDKRIKEQWGYFVYPAPDGPHPIDRVAIGYNKPTFFYDVKTKNHMNWGATGFNTISFENYKKINSDINPVIIIFVDPMSGTIYGNRLTELMKPLKRDKLTFPRYIYDGKIVTFPMEHMKTYWTLTTDEIKELKNLQV